MSSFNVSLDSGNVKEISQNLYGIFFEDINFSCDGGINANMVCNYSFDGVFFSNEELKAVDDPLRYWKVENGSLESGTENPLHQNSRYGRLSVDGHTIISNLGFNGLKDHKDECAMNIRQGQEYLFECWLRSEDYNGTLTLQVKGENGQILAVLKDGQSESTFADNTLAEDPDLKNSWRKFSCTLSGVGSGYGKLEIILQGTGTLDLDCISLMDADYWNKDDPKWRHGKLRKDLIQALADLKPSFMRFPGGCIVEGQLPGNEYNWKDTVGELYERKSNYCLWSEKVPDGGTELSDTFLHERRNGMPEYTC